jgi:hypothetical protein
LGRQRILGRKDRGEGPVRKEKIRNNRKGKLRSNRKIKNR